jgi:hypothetical protein
MLVLVEHIEADGTPDPSVDFLRRCGPDPEPVVGTRLFGLVGHAIAGLRVT